MPARIIEVPQWPVLTTVIVGGVPKEQLLAELRNLEGDASVDADALRTIASDAFDIWEQPTRIRVVLAQLSALGIKSPIRFRYLPGYAHILGLDLLPPQVVPPFWLKHRQELGHHVAWVATEPIEREPHFEPYIFCMGEHGLEECEAFGDTLFYPQNHLLFKFRKGPGPKKST
jgi:hypothetical protein